MKLAKPAGVKFWKLLLILVTVLLGVGDAVAGPEAEQLANELRVKLKGKWRAQDFAGIEAVYGDLIREHEKSVGGIGNRQMYILSVYHYTNSVCSERPNCDELLMKWIETQDGCVACKIALASRTKDAAWEARGEGASQAMGRSSAEEYAQGMKAASGIVEALSGRVHHDAYFASLRLNMAHEMGAPREVTDALYDQARALAPTSLDILQVHVRGSLPRWGGEPGDVRLVAEKAAEGTKAKLGDAFYALAASTVFGFEPEQLYEGHHFEWERIKKGWQDLIKENPDRVNKITFAMMAMHANDDVTGKEIVKNLGAYGPDIQSYFKSAGEYSSWVRRIESMKPAKPESPLFAAVRAGDRKLVEKLIAGGEDVNQKNNRYETPIGHALEFHPELFDLLLSKGAKLNVTFHGMPLLCYAASRGSLHAVEEILKTGAAVRIGGGGCASPLTEAVRNNYPAIVKALVTAGALPTEMNDEQRETVLMMAARLKRVESVKELLAAKDVSINLKDRDGSTALHYAARSGSKEIAEMLVAAGADASIEAPGKGNAAKVATDSGFPEVAAVLGKAAGDLSTETPLSLAVKNGDRAQVVSLLEAKANVNEIRKDGQSALANAVEFHPELVDLLLAKGAAAGMPTAKGEPLLNIATVRGDVELIKKLISLGGAMPTMHSRETKTTAYHIAVEKNDPQLVEALMTNPVFAPNSNDMARHLTPLQLAAELNAVNAARALLKNPQILVNAPRMDVANKRMTNALMMAEERGHKELAALLREHGAEPVKQPGQ